jgi:protein-tyrosine sulfotransferase
VWRQFSFVQAFAGTAPRAGGLVKPTPPIFVLSAERSGSTLLRYLLDTHPEIAAPGELALGALSAHLMMVHRRLSLAQASERTRKIVSEIMLTYLQSRQKRVWCDKSPLNAVHTRALESVFPDARYICLYRTCRDTAHSSYTWLRHGAMHNHRRYIARHPGNFPRALVEYWCDRTEGMLDFERRLGARVTRLRYEDLVTRPDEEMQKVMAFIELPWHPWILERAFAIPHPSGGDINGDIKIASERAIHTRSIGLGRLLPVNMLPSSLVRRANESLDVLGYDRLPLAINGDEEAAEVEAYAD